MADAPTSISRYQIVEQLASSDAGVVYKAFDPMIERMVAVKVLSVARDGGSIDAGVKEAFYREMQKAGTLNHPAIAMLFDVGEAQEGLFAAAEFVEGASLVKGIDSTLDVRARISLIGQVADALEYAQEMGVPHLNLKPSSVLVRPDLSVKVTGFGIARILSALGRVTGKPRPWTSRFVAPERRAGADGDARSDVFAFAMLTRELLSGETMEDSAASDAAPGHDAAALACPARLAALGFSESAWKETFGRALSANPADRFPSATAFLSAVTQVLGVTRPMTPRVWAASSRVMVGEGFADQGKWAETSAGNMAAPAPGARADDESVTWSQSGVLPAQSLRTDVDVSPDPDTTALAARVALQGLTPPVGPPPVPIPAVPSAPATVAPPVAVPAVSRQSRRAFPKATALLLGLLAGVLAVAALWYFVPAVRHLIGSRSEESSSTDASGAVTPAPISEPAAPNPPEASSVPVAPPSVEAAPSVPAAGTTLGLLRITTIPAGAQVTIDGKPRGVTPLRLGNLSLTPHTVQVALDGYAPETPQVVLTPNRASQTLNLTLRPVAKEAESVQLSIETLPPGATIFMDDERVGDSPVAMAKAVPGRHRVRAERDGFESATRELDLRVGEPVTLTIQLTPKVVAAASGPIEFDRVQVKPRQTAGTASPGYPGPARAAKLTGFVVASWVIDEKGAVDGITIAEASSPVFETAVRNWLQSVRYAPGQQAGQPVKVVVKRRFSFALGREEH